MRILYIREIKNETMKLLLCIVLSIFTLASCAKSNYPKGTPKCIVLKIEELKLKNDNSASVYQYANHAEIVYLVSPGCCDMFIELYDNKCNYICAPSGGFTGKGDGKCEDLDLQNEVLIWTPK